MALEVPRENECGIAGLPIAEFLISFLFFLGGCWFCSWLELLNFTVLGKLFLFSSCLEGAGKSDVVCWLIKSCEVVCFAGWFERESITTCFLRRANTHLHVGGPNSSCALSSL